MRAFCRAIFDTHDPEALLIENLPQGAGRSRLSSPGGGSMYSLDSKGSAERGGKSIYVQTYAPCKYPSHFGLCHLAYWHLCLINNTFEVPNVNIKCNFEVFVFGSR